MMWSLYDDDVEPLDFLNSSLAFHFVTESTSALWQGLDTTFKGLDASAVIWRAEVLPL